MQINGEEKATIRAVALARRDAIPAPVKAIKDRAITDRLLQCEQYRSARTVVFYASFRSEVATFEAIAKTLELGKTVLVPRVNTEDLSLDLYQITGSEELSPGYMGIPEPTASPAARRDVGSADLVVLPGAAFDERGGRIGYGKGCYDRLLAEAGPRPALLALAYEEQLASEIPVQAHDISVGTIVTDRRVILCHGQG